MWSCRDLGAVPGSKTSKLDSAELFVPCLCSRGSSWVFESAVKVVGARNGIEEKPRRVRIEKEESASV